MSFALNVQQINGDRFQLEVRGDWPGWELSAVLAQRLPQDVPGMYTAIVKDSMIDLEKTLGDQGIVDGDDVTVVFKEGSEEQVEDVKNKYCAGDAQTMTKEELLVFNSLRELAGGGWGFQKSTEDVALPSGLQSLDLGGNMINGKGGKRGDGDYTTGYSMSVEGIPFPSGLQSLIIGDENPEGACGEGFGPGGSPFNEPMENIALPDGLRSLAIRGWFNRSMEKVKLPSALQTLIFGRKFNQNMEKVALPSGLQSLTFGCDFNQDMSKVVLPSGLQSLTFGDKFNQDMSKVALPPGLQSLTFGCDFNQDMSKVVLPSGLQSLTVPQKFN